MNKENIAKKNNIKQSVIMLLLSAILYMIAIILHSQTTFDQGDLAIIGMNGNNVGCSGVTAEDRISFVSFVPITTGTNLDFTDNGYERTTLGLWGDTEGNYRFTYTGTTIAAGTIITFVFDNAGGVVMPAGWAFAKLPGFTGNFNMNTGGDQIYITQGGTWNNPAGAHNATFTGGRFLAAFNTRAIWAADGTTQQSNLHPSCTCINFAVGAATDFVLYTGSLTATNRFDWYLRLTSSVNWTNQVNCTTYNTNFALLPASIPFTVSSSISTWTGAVDINWFNCQNWNPTRVPNEFANVIIPNGVPNMPTINSTAAFSDDFQDTARCNNLDLNGGKLTISGGSNTHVLSAFGNITISGTPNSELIMTDLNPASIDGKIFIRGNWINNKSDIDFKEGNGEIIFNGSNNQTISTVDVSGIEPFYNLTINKISNNVILNNHVEVGAASTAILSERTGFLTLSSRNIITGANYILVTNPSLGGIVGGSATSFVDGNLRRQTNTIDLYDYPTGEGTRYMRSAIRTTSTNLTEVEVNANNTGYGIYSPLEATLFNVSTMRWWDVTKISGTNSVFVRLYWNAAASSEGIFSVADLVVAHYSNRDHTGALSTLQWWNRGRNVANSSGLVPDGWVEANEAVATFSPFTFSSLTPINPLPIELVYFNAICESEKIKFSWATSSETNNKQFIIEGSDDLIHTNPIAIIEAISNSNSHTEYSYIYDGANRYTYYRLVQEDIDNVRENFNFLSIECNKENISLFIQNNQLEITGLSSNYKYTFSLFDISGKIISMENIIGSELAQIPISSITNGVYLVKLVNNTNNSITCFKFLY